MLYVREFQARGLVARVSSSSQEKKALSSVPESACLTISPIHAMALSQHEYARKQAASTSFSKCFNAKGTYTSLKSLPLGPFWLEISTSNFSLVLSLTSVMAKSKVYFRNRKKICWRTLQVRKRVRRSCRILHSSWWLLHCGIVSTQRHCFDKWLESEAMAELTPSSMHPRSQK